mmetsp:Transcript_36919/g.72647  ORF Transcript_36919/g.72647 Transcript_36919/m.72647 type:complete len:84 (-) Transcript_36919:5-256(-)
MGTGGAQAGSWKERGTGGTSSGLLCDGHWRGYSATLGFFQNSGFTAWIWWMKILEGEVVSVCLCLKSMLFGFMFGRVGCDLQI